MYLQLLYRINEYLSLAFLREADLWNDLVVSLRELNCMDNDKFGEGV